MLKWFADFTKNECSTKRNEIMLLYIWLISPDEKNLEGTRKAIKKLVEASAKNDEELVKSFSAAVLQVNN